MKVDRPGSLPVPHTRPEDTASSQHSAQRTTRQHPLNLDSQPPEPIPQERPGRPPLDTWLGSDLQKDHNPDHQVTPSSQSHRISTWLRLQMTALRQTAESVFAPTKHAPDPSMIPVSAEENRSASDSPSVQEQASPSQETGTETTS